MSRTHYIIALQMPSILGGERRKGAIRYIRRYESYDFSEYPSGTKGARTHPRRPCESTERCKADRCQMGIGGISSRSRKRLMRLQSSWAISVDDLIAHNEAATGDPIPPRGKHIFGIVRMGERGQIVIPKKAQRYLRAARRIRTARFGRRSTRHRTAEGRRCGIHA